jgi:hypothetical protein
MNALNFDRAADPSTFNSDNLFWPTIEALRELGGSATNEAIVAKMVEITKPAPELLTPRADRQGMSLFAYGAGWCRSWLKKGGALVNAARGVWALADLGESVTLDDLPAVIETANRVYEEEKREKVADEYNPHMNGQSFTIAIVVSPVTARRWLNGGVPIAANLERVIEQMTALSEALAHKPEER